jgi:hypothetical protein
VSTDLDAELRAAFERVTEPISPPADLADRARRAVRRKLATGITTAVALAAAASIVAALVITKPAVSRVAPRHTTHQIIVRPTSGQNVQGLAVSGPYLYIATDFNGYPPYALAAYNRATGQLIRRISVPAEPNQLTTGPGHSVWLTFLPDQAGGPCGGWLLTADLGRRSAFSVCQSTVLPIGPETALTEVRQRELGTLSMPPPGHAGRAAVHADAHIGNYALSELAQVGRHVAVILANDFFNLLIIVGQNGARFGGRNGPQIQSMAAQAGSLWVVASPLSRTADTGPLIRFSADLRRTTPTAIRRNPVLEQSEQVWTEANTVFVTSAVASHHLVCFSAHGAPGKLATIPVLGDVGTIAAAGHTVYVTISPYSPVNLPDAGDVIRYPIPPQCR